jgi:hypothetical protein
LAWKQSPGMEGIVQKELLFWPITASKASPPHVRPTTFRFANCKARTTDIHQHHKSLEKIISCSKWNYWEIIPNLAKRLCKGRETARRKRRDRNLCHSAWEQQRRRGTNGQENIHHIPLRTLEAFCDWFQPWGLGGFGVSLKWQWTSREIGPWGSSLPLLPPRPIRRNAHAKIVVSLHGLLWGEFFTQIERQLAEKPQSPD